MSGEDFDLRDPLSLGLTSSGPREGDGTETTERGGSGGGETKRSSAALSASARGPRKGDGTVPVEEGERPRASRGDQTESTPFG